MNFSLKKLFDSNRLLVGVCAILLIVNASVFVYLAAATLISVPFIILSNIITALLMLMLFKPVNQIIKEAVEEERNAESGREEKLVKEKNELQKKNENLSAEILELSTEKEQLQNELDTAKQYNSFETAQKLTAKLETMEYEKEGYIVKEEIVRHTNYSEEIAKSNPWLLDFSDKGEQKVFFTKKYHDKALIGIDLTKVRFCRTADGRVCLEGVRFENLHKEMTLKKNGKNEINRCFVLNCKDDKTTVNNDTKYNSFKKWYTETQDSIFQINFNAEVDEICDRYTLVLRKTLQERFPKISFVDGQLEDSLGADAFSAGFLDSGKEPDLIKISNSMMMISTAIKNTMPVINNP
jgi:hypothetical protein